MKGICLNFSQETMTVKEIGAIKKKKKQSTLYWDQSKDAQRTS